MHEEHPRVAREPDDRLVHLVGQQLGDPLVHDISNYIRKGKMWEAFVSDKLPVLLIDEIDKADIEFPNDLLRELDQMEFYVYETRQQVRARQRPIILITSNNEKELPDAFLRRCFFHYIPFPDANTLRQIIQVHYPDLREQLIAEALEVFLAVRELPGLKKKPSTSELLDWLRLLADERLTPGSAPLAASLAGSSAPPHAGALLKNEQDQHLLDRLIGLVKNRR